MDPYIMVDMNNNFSSLAKEIYEEAKDYEYVDVPVVSGRDKGVMDKVVAVLVGVLMKLWQRWTI